jgi:hypothetical protein
MVNEGQKTQEEPRRPMGTLACIAAGFEVVARHPGTIVVPLLLDLFLWLGPRLSLAPLFHALNGFLKESLPSSGTGASEVEEVYLLMGQGLNEMASEFNLFSSLEPAPLLGVPTLTSIRMTLTSPLGPRSEIIVASIFGALGWIILLTLLGLGINAVYLKIVGQSVLDETESPLAGPRALPVLWGQFVLLALILIVAACVLSFAVLSVIALISLFSLTFAGFVVMMLFSMIMFAGFHLIFAIPGMVQLRRSPLRAIQESLLLTRGAFPSVTFLVVLILVISRGLTVVWSLPDPATWANLIGIAGHAFVSTALTAALFIFYQERLAFLDMLQKVVTAQEPAVQPAVGE